MNSRDHDKKREISTRNRKNAEQGNRILNSAKSGNTTRSKQVERAE